MRESANALVDGRTYATGDPFAIWDSMRSTEPVLWQETADFGGFWSLTRHTDVKEVLRDAETFASSSGTLLRPLAQGADPGSARTLALSDAPRHTALRTAVADWFAPRNLRLLAASMEAAAHDIVTRAVQRCRIDFVTEVAAKLPLEVIWRFLGIPAADRPQITAWSMDAFCAGSPAARSIAHLEILDYFGDLVRQRRRHPGDDLVSLLAGLKLDDKLLPVEDVVLNCDNLLVGGTENVRLAMSGGIQALLTRPRQWELLRGNFERVAPTAVEEILRWTSSATHLMRVARTDAYVADTKIARGDRVVAWLPAANHDPAEFPDPGRFDLTRSPNRHLALGAGPHYCVGIQLAKLEIRAVLAELTSHVRRIHPDGRADRLNSLVVNGFRSLPVHLETSPGSSGRDRAYCSALVRVVGSNS